jgi:hypothetical protein
MKREEMIVLRTSLLRGVPPYETDAMGNYRRERGGTMGLHELLKQGDFSPLAASVRLMLDTEVKILDHLLERLR